MASGPSLTEDQVGLCREAGLVLIGCNDAYRLKPTIDVLYAADQRWITHHAPAWNVIPKSHKFTPLQKGFKYPDDWTLLRGEDGKGLSLDRERINWGTTAGFALINIAVLLGIRTMVLLGFDYHHGRDHWFGRHPGVMDHNSDFTMYSKKFDGVTADLERLGVTVVNATPGSAITTFPMMDLKDVLA